MAGTPVDIRNPGSVRPWQHVLAPLSGYLTLAARLLGDNGASFADAWNFGPEPQAFLNVGPLARTICGAWGAGAPPLRPAVGGGPPRSEQRPRGRAWVSTWRSWWSPRVEHKHKL